MKRYINDKGEFATSSMIIDGRMVSNPTEEMLVKAGYHEYVEPAKTLEECKAEKVNEITAYDNSEAVNSFSYKGVSMWLDKETRVGLFLRFRSEQAAGNTQTTLWSGTQSFALDIADGLKMLAAVEVYASAAYDVTAKHKANVIALTDADEVKGYDYKTGYPAKLEL